MILGTVQLGTNYGINNSTGKPDKTKAYNILNTAYDGGIRLLDTAPAYGNSEEIIGEFHKDRKKFFKICTKLPIDIKPNCNEVLEAINKSKDKLYINSIYCCYLHRFEQCKNKEIINGLLQAKEKTLIDNIGISIYKPYELEYICDNLDDVVNIVQIPINIFSLHLWCDALKKAKKKNIKIFARSIFLQGLALMDINSSFIDEIGAKKYVEFVQHLAKIGKQPITQLCYDAVASNEYIDDILFGCETEEQLKNNISLERNYNKFTDIEKQKTFEMMKDINNTIIDPSLWKVK